jgi:ParB/RepB/Spo0J family partition protein
MSKLATGIISTTKVYLVDPTLIDIVEGHNPRFDFGDIDALAELIEDQHRKDGVGVLRPLNVKRKDGGRFELVSGERRLMSVNALLRKGVEFARGVPVNIVDKNTTDIELLITDLIDNSSKPLLPLEEAHAFKRLVDAGMTQMQIAKTTGRGPAHVFASLKMLQADDDVTDALKKGDINATLAKDIAMKVSDKTEQKKLVKQIREAGGDKKKLAAVKKSVKTQVRASQEKRAAGRGKTLKMRALSDDQLKDLGTKVDGYLEELIKDAGITREVLFNRCESSNEFAAAFTLGALTALKAAAGLKVNLKL